MSARVGGVAVIQFRYTLVGEGSSDALLLHLIDWLWKQRACLSPTGEFFNPKKLRFLPLSLREKIRTALDLYPCDVLFVHRDADNASIEEREAEILRAVDGIDSPPLVCVVPVRETEAWLLFDEQSIRMAAGNPNGTESLSLPPLKRCEAISDPKQTLFDALRKACGLRGRKYKGFSPERARLRTAELIQDFSPLRELPAFARLEKEMEHLTERLFAAEMGERTHV